MLVRKNTSHHIWVGHFKPLFTFYFMLGYIPYHLLKHLMILKKRTLLLQLIAHIKKMNKFLYSKLYLACSSLLKPWSNLHVTFTTMYVQSSCCNYFILSFSKVHFSKMYCKYNRKTRVKYSVCIYVGLSVSNCKIYQNYIASMILKLF